MTSSEINACQAFYFGCARGIDYHEVGHYLFTDDGRGGLMELGDRWPGGRLDAMIPWGSTPDGTLAPRPTGRHSEAPQGVAALHHKDGWTALSFWDRSGDRRGNSNSTFMFDQTLDFDGALALARERFSALFERFPFEVVPYVA